MKNFIPLIRPARTALAMLAASLIVSCVAIVLLHGDLLKKKQHMFQIRRQLSILRDETNQLRRDLETTGKLATRYRQLQQSGFIGDADRNGWMQRLEGIYRETRLPDTLRYALSAPEPIDASPASGSRAYRNGVLQHELKLELSNINDEDFLDFMGRLSADWKAPYLVRACQISRASEVAAGLQVQCTLELYSLPERRRG